MNNQELYLRIKGFHFITLSSIFVCTGAITTGFYSIISYAVAAVYIAMAIYYSKEVK